MSETENRKKWKEARAQNSYGMSYDALCSDRKKVINQIYIVLKAENDAKTKRGCK